MSLDIPYRSTSTGGGVFLAPNLSFAGDSNNSGYIASNETTTSSLAPILTLTGKFILDLCFITSMIAESTDIKLTVDSVVIWDETFTSGTSLDLIGLTSARGVSQEGVRCDTSLVLELAKATDTSITLNYLARPIL